MAYDFFKVSKPGLSEEKVPDKKYLGNCQYCGKKIESDNDNALKNHEKRCSKNPINKQKQCRFCGKLFKVYNDELQDHEEICSQNPEVYNKNPIQPGVSLGAFESKLDQVIDLAKLAPLAQPHILTEDNLIFAIRMKGSVKLNDLRWYFHKTDNKDIQIMLKDLHENKKLLKKSSEGWYKVR